MNRPLTLTLPLARPALAPLAAAPESASLQASALRLHSEADRAAALQAWSTLAARIDALRFFHTPEWMGSWLHGVPAAAPLWLLQAHHEGQCVGLAFVTRGPARRLARLPFVPAWHLHATGTALDGVCLEYNDFLVDPAAGAAVRGALIDQWRQLGRGARELHLAHLGEAAAAATWEAARQARPRLTTQHLSKPTFSVNLERVRAAGHDVLALRSANLRAQVRRSLRAYAALGELRLEAAPDLPTARSWFAQLGQLHQQHWTERGQPGAFAQPGFVDCHHRLLERCGVDPTRPTHVQLLRLTAGEHAVACLYNLVHRGHVHFYQSGLDYAIGGKQARPGYAAHVLAIEYNARLGHAVYDFLMGEARYKRDLATDTATMPSVVLQTGAWRLAAERVLRRWRAARRTGPAAAPLEPDTAA